MAKKFSGKLAKQIDAPKPIGIIRSAMTDGGAKHLAAELARIATERISKLDLLAERYGITPTGDYYRDLALALAKEFVPGFSVARPRGRPEKWPDFLCGALVVKMKEKIQPKTKKGPAYAAKQLSKAAPWKEMVRDLDEPAEALLNVYKKTMREEPDLVDAIERLQASAKTGKDGKSQFDAMVAQYIAEITHQ